VERLDTDIQNLEKKVDRLGKALDQMNQKNNPWKASDLTPPG
jgi:hypothetical protein